MKKITVLAFAALLSFGCTSDDTTVVTDPATIVPEQPQDPEPQNPEPENPQPVTVEFEEVYKSSFSQGMISVMPMGNYVINTDAEWQAFFTYPIIGQIAVPNPQIELPLDTSNYTYIAVRHSFNADSYEGIDARIESVSSFEGTITVQFIRTSIAPGQTILTLAAQPYHIVRIPKTTLPIVFEQL